MNKEDWGLAKPQGQQFDSNTGAPQSANNTKPGEEPVAAINSDPVSETTCGSFTGTPAYAPPEQLRRELRTPLPCVASVDPSFTLESGITETFLAKRQQRIGRPRFLLRLLL